METNEVKIFRMQDIGYGKLAFSTVTGINCEIQILDDDKNALDDGVYGKSYVMYSDTNTNVYPGDQLKDVYGNKYTVKAGGVSNRNHGRIGFSRIILELTEE